MRLAGHEDKDRYVIRRIRLLKFHNIENETIELKGHLFLLGDNGSGKTTILDAIHYVLTGGDLELNAAARVAGRRARGRTAQGIVMRYNADTGPLAKSGGVTYAALELANPRGKLLTIGIGMTTSSMEERISQWGIVENKALEEIPFLMTDLGGSRPCNKLELKKLMGANAGIFTIGAYKKELARRIFGGEDSFPDICRLLSMGKAYREIVSRSADYHELFVRLLPEPRTDVFERLIDGLHDLEGAQNELGKLAEKAAYLKELADLRDKIGLKHEEIARYEWLKCHYHLGELARKAGDLAQRIEAARANQEAEETVLTEKRQARDRAARRLDDLKAKDKAGLVRQEKDLASQVTDLSERSNRRKTALKHLEKEAAELAREMDKGHALFAKTCAVARKEFAGFNLPFSLTPLLQYLDERTHDQPDQLPESPRLDPLLEEAASHRDTFLERRVQLDARISDLELRLNEAEVELKRLLDHQEAEIPEVARARRLLADHMIQARPLYELLAWKPAIRKNTAAEVESFIGSRILGMLLVDRDHFARAREVLFPIFPDLPLSHEQLGIDELPQWIRDTFDLTDPIPLTLLAAEMVAHREPRVDRVADYPVLDFRAHLRRLDPKPASLIGVEARRRAWEEACRRQRAEIKELKARWRALDKQRRELSEAIAGLDHFAQKIRHLRGDLTGKIGEMEKAALTRRHQQASLASARADLAELVAELKAGEIRLTQMRRLITERGLDQLERQITRVQREVKQAETDMETRNQRIGQHRATGERLAADKVEMDRRSTHLNEERGRRAEVLQLLCPDVEDIAYYVLRTWKGFQFSTLDRIEAAIRASEKEKNETMGLLTAQLKDPTMASSYAFYYDEASNGLTDRRGRHLAEALEFQNRAIESQNQVINDKTIGLFKEIILNELVRVLREQVFQLENMVKHINRLLKDRDFGNNHYRFTQRPQDRCRELVEIIRKLSAFEEESEQNLREFFEDHRDEILNTEPGDVPAILDYRNWYRFEMTVATRRSGAEDGAEVTMDRRVKAAGSGGEQAVPNYLLVLTIAYFLYHGSREKHAKLHALLFDEAFYGIDSGRRDQLLGFADDLGLQLMVASPDQDGVKNEIAFSKTLLVMKDENYDVHVHEFEWSNPAATPQMSLLDEETPPPVSFSPVKDPQ